MANNRVGDPIMFRDDHGCSRFNGKTCVVTAGTMGIGLAICHRLLSENCKAIYLCSRKQINVDEALLVLRAKYGSNRVFGVACNVTQEGALETFCNAVVKEFPIIDVVVSNVGVNPSAGNALDMSDANYDKIMNANVRSHWKLIKLLSPNLCRPGASILLTSSVAAYTPNYPLGIYGMSKTAMIGLTKALASELGKDGIRVNAICPGLVKTKMAEMLWKNEENSREGGAFSNFIGQIGDPEDMVGTMAFLLSRDSKHITGESIVVDGGSQARL
jgi:dehydrogenase/reductase SDR family protein 4